MGIEKWFHRKLYIQIGMLVWNPNSEISNSELNEHVLPLFYTFHRIAKTINICKIATTNKTKPIRIVQCIESPKNLGIFKIGYFSIISKIQYM